MTNEERNGLTIDDALNDAAFTRLHPYSGSAEYLSQDCHLWRLLAAVASENPKDCAAIVQIIAAEFANGREVLPDAEKGLNAVSGCTLDGLRVSIRKRLDAEYLRRYKLFLSKKS